MDWVLLIGSGVLEAVWATALGASEGLKRRGPAIVFATAAVFSLVGLALAMRTLPTGTAYAVWTATGATLTVASAMIRGTERGVLVTRLWYLRAVDQRTLVYTGLTRDGTFLVENGRISRSIKNFRFNDSPLLMLNKVDAIGPTVRTDGGVFPAIKARDFAFTSLSDAV